MRDKLEFIGIKELSHLFYKEYDPEQFPELLKKQNRPYSMFVMKITNETKDTLYVCLPFRSNLNTKRKTHIPFAYSFTVDNHRANPGLDYTKSIILKKNIYIGREAIIDSREYQVLINRTKIISRQVAKYINTYCDHMNGKKLLDKKEFERLFKYSTLQYFHDELGIASEFFDEIKS